MWSTIIMEDLINAIILGVVQGLSEFLPISSSGHLVLFSNLLGFEEEGVAFEVFVHFGTLLSVLLAFRKDLFEMIKALYLFGIKKDNNFRMSFMWDIYIIVGTIPVAIIGLTFKDPIESLFTDPLLVLVFLFITGFIMWLSKFFTDRHKPFNYGRVLVIGLAQTAAILPGISRSGSTIFAGITMGMNRVQVAKFSFLLSIPAILGAVVIKLNDLLAMPPSSGEIIILIAGTLSAFISGYVAIILLLDVVRRGKLQYFGYYCFMVSIVGLAWYVF
ncbi:MAG: undecaprenyl-diphosphate phosphatase [Caldithrix sp.]|nr:undecaprenyl-diphosphate phosphatase [Caldithrix sp.]